MQLERLNTTSYNNEHYLMKIIQYNRAGDILVEFQDDNKAVIHSAYREFINGEIKNIVYERKKINFR